MNDEYPVVGRMASSNGVDSYAIRQREDGSFVCECKGFLHRNKCRHVDNFVLSPPTTRKIYLSDGAYAEFNGYEVILTAENGIEATDTVVLDATGVRLLVGFLRDLGVKI